MWTSEHSVYTNDKLLISVIWLVCKDLIIQMQGKKKMALDNQNIGPCILI